MSKSLLLRQSSVAIVLTNPGASGRKILAVDRVLDSTPDTVAWGLPGGKVETGEARDVAALRELREESGLDGQDPCLIYSGVLTPEDRGGEPFLVSAYLVSVLRGQRDVIPELGHRVEYLKIDAFERASAFPEYHGAVINTLRVMGEIPWLGPPKNQIARWHHRALRHSIETRFDILKHPRFSLVELCACAERFGIETALAAEVESGVYHAPAQVPPSLAEQMWQAMRVNPMLITPGQREAMLFAFSSGLTRGLREKHIAQAYILAEKTPCKGAARG